MVKKQVKISVALNRKALYDYEIIETFEAGLCLKGPEVKSLRKGQANLSSSFARAEEDGIYIYGLQIQPYEFNSVIKIDPLRVRKLLLNKTEIKKISSKSREKGFSLIPLEIYFKNGWAKISLAIAKGKKTFDKKEKIKERDLNRDVRRDIKNKY
ncbi:MAG: SsrA-binding protein SmpB [Elusimicrobia bacterium]|nr:SsrA-binding protein SmpB [Elusimicrobiota bacterium]